MPAEVVTQIMAARAVELVSESPFYIPMTGPAARPRRSLKHDDTFIVLDSHGDIGASAGGPDGLFNADTRYLARLELVLDDVQPLLLGSNLRDDNSALTIDLTNPDVYRDGRIVLQRDMLHIVRTIFLWRGTAYQRIGIQNHSETTASFDVTLLFDNDFADLFEVRGEKRARRGVGASKLLGPADVALEYKGLDGKARATALHFDPRPTRLPRMPRPIISTSRRNRRVRCSLPPPATSRRRSSRCRSSAACWRIVARCASRPPAPPASKPQTISSTRWCASRWPTSTC